LVLVVVERQIFSFWYFVYHHKKCGEFGLFVGTLLYLGVAYLIPCHLFFTLKMRYVFEHVNFSYFYAHWLLLCSLVELWSQSCVDWIL
jgi:hypothetical protein